MVENPIPYKPEDTKWPKIDFEVAETEYEFPNKWGTTDRKKVKHPSSKENLFIGIDHTVIIILIRMEFISNLHLFIPMTKSLIQLIRGMIGFMISMIGIIPEVIVLSSL